MKIKIYEDYNCLSSAAARVLAGDILKNPRLILGLATGETPLGLYAELARFNDLGVISFKDVISFNLDEYYGLAPEHPASYRAFMEEYLFEKIDIDEKNTYLLDGLTNDPFETCAVFDQMIEDRGGIDVQVLGIGVNGHIGFNEPAEAFRIEAHLADLTESTIKVNSRFFDSPDEMPRQALTVGFKTIMQARKIILMASTANKAEAIRATVKGPVRPQSPASLLQLHPNVTLYLTEEAAALL